ncbi:uncharacterized protein L203_104362 [Cryptococcus depauperatus CBS 7841]|uniref:Mediator of RNA polymerase II transcription subunit 7 n=1 Tax=Cryptococcus depauperatus CBS 7841 TaxID=1295531 RepID=A0A1E3IIG8_9TREE|nr:hypothetical protein L203_03298 [Cryptococcus depauperatus CBS 7841]
MNNSQPDDKLPITNTVFPPPPSYYKQFTHENVQRYETLTGKPFNPREKGKCRAKMDEKVDVERIEVDDHGDRREVELTTEEREELKDLEERFKKPRADWVQEEGRWMCFNNVYTTEPTIPTAESIGVEPFVDPAEEPQTSLPPLLHSFLHTLLLLLDTLTMTPRKSSALEAAGWDSEGNQYIQHLANLSMNMMVASNQLRTAQSEATLVLLMEKELAERRKQTEKLHAKCAEIAKGIKTLRELGEN